jgi:hypothetical protein
VEEVAVGRVRAWRVYSARGSARGKFPARAANFLARAFFPPPLEQRGSARARQTGGFLPRGFLARLLEMLLHLAKNEVCIRHTQLLFIHHFILFSLYLASDADKQLQQQPNVNIQNVFLMEVNIQNILAVHPLDCSTFSLPS